MAKRKKPAPAWRQMGFQLNQNDLEDSQRMDVIAWLAARREKNTVLRDGLDIVYALRHLNDVTPLLKFFPNITELISMHSDPLLKAIFDQQQEILRRLNELESKGISTQPIVSTGKLTNAAIAMPTFDDDDDTVVMRADPNAGADAASKFLDAAIGIQVVETPL